MTQQIPIPEGIRVGSADDPESPQPKNGDWVIVLERPALSSERLRAGQIGVVETRPLLNWRGRPVVAAGCPWVVVDGYGKVLAKRWAILTDD